MQIGERDGRNGSLCVEQAAGGDSGVGVNTPLPVATPRNKLQQTQTRSTQHLHSISQLSTSLKDQSSKNMFQRNTIFYQTHILQPGHILQVQLNMPFF
jgi:hypothetical protein